MPHEEKIETISGDLLRLLFSPKGSIEGLLVWSASKTMQVVIDQCDLEAGWLNQAVGNPIQLEGRLDRSHKTKGGAHPVYKLEKILRLKGNHLPTDVKPKAISGVVAAIHYAKHGEPNGVILESGEFIHTVLPA